MTISSAQQEPLAHKPGAAVARPFLTRTWRDLLNDVADVLATSWSVGDSATITIELIDDDQFVDAAGKTEPIPFEVQLDTGVLRMGEPTATPDLRLRGTRAAIFDLIVAVRIEDCTQAMERGELTFVGPLEALMVFLNTQHHPARRELTQRLLAETQPPPRRPSEPARSIGPLTFPDSSEYLGAFIGDRTLITRLDATRAALERLVRRRDTPGFQLSLRVGIESQTATACGGFARAGEEMQPTTLLPWLCCSKVAAVIAFAQLWTRGLVDASTPVAAVIPEFGRNGKDRLTFTQLLTHTTGITDEPVPPLSFSDLQLVLRAICDDGTISGDGTSASYSVGWAWIVLGRAIEVLSGESFGAYVATRIAGRLGLTSVFFGAEDLRDDLAERGFGGVGLLYSCRDGAEAVLPLFTHRHHFAVALPHLGMLSTAHDLVELLDTFITRPDKLDINRQVQQAIAAPHRVGVHDPFYGGHFDWGLGLCTDGRLFGGSCSRRSIGHVGFRSSCVLHDPSLDLTAALHTNGVTRRRINVERTSGIIDALVTDLA